MFSISDNNTIVIGPCGSGKTSLLKDKIRKFQGSYIINDITGDIYADLSKELLDAGYKVKIIDFTKPEKSDHYNPFEYIEDENDIVSLVNDIYNSTEKNKNLADPFWERSEKLFMMMLVAYLHYHCTPESRNFSTMNTLIQEMCPIDSQSISALEKMLEDIEEKDPDSFCSKCYKTFKLSADKTKRSIAISVGVRLQIYNLRAAAELTDNDTVNIKGLTEEKTALFVISAPYDGVLSPLKPFFFSHILSVLMKRKNNNLLPVYIMLDEIANEGVIYNLSQCISTIKRRNISVIMTLQSIKQLKALYKDDWELIYTNCDKVVTGISDIETTDRITEDIKKNQKLRETAQNIFVISN